MPLQVETILFEASTRWTDYDHENDTSISVI